MGQFSQWSKQKQQMCRLKTQTYSLPAGGAYGAAEIIWSDFSVIAAQKAQSAVLMFISCLFEV